MKEEICPEGGRVLRIVRGRELTSATEREATFDPDWPYTDDKSPKKMSQAGFYRSENWTVDTVRCRYCHIMIHSWDPEDTPLGEHRKHSPKCVFLNVFPEGVGDVDEQTEYCSIETHFLYLINHPNGVSRDYNLECFCCFCAHQPVCLYENVDNPRCIRCNYKITYKCKAKQSLLDIMGVDETD